MNRLHDELAKGGGGADTAVQYTGCLTRFCRAQELCESRRGRPGLPVPNSPYGLCRRKVELDISSELRSCMKVEVDVLGSPSLISLVVSVDVKQH